MSFPRYICAVNSALREIVLPETLTERARNTIESCTRILAAIATALDVDPEMRRHSFYPALLPDVLKPMIPKAACTTDHISLPSIHPGHDVAVNNATLALHQVGAAWLSEAAWEIESSLKLYADTLIAEDQAVRSHIIDTMELMEQGFPAVTDADSKAGEIGRTDLQAYLRKYLNDDQFTITEFRFVSGRGSRQTALFSTSGRGDFPEHVVIQRDDPRNVFTFTVVNQYPLLERAYRAGLKVPRPLLLEQSRDVLGAPFMLVERLPGSPPIDGMNYFDPPPKLPRIAIGLAQQMALLHQVPVGDLAATLPHSLDNRKGEQWIDLVDRYEILWNSMAHLPSIPVTAAFAWMRHHIGCAENIEVLVHADALLHNLLVHNEEITALLDWELAHIGHPAEDIGYLKPVLEQMINWDDFMNAYYAAGGRAMSNEQISFFTLLPLLKLIVQGLQAALAFESGQSNDLVLAECSASFVPKLINRLGQQLLSILQCSN